MKFSFWSRVSVLTGIFICLAGCSYSPSKCLKLLEKSFHKTYDIIVVPGVPLENGKWSTTMKARIYWSKYLYDKGIAKNIMYSGSAVYSPYYEGEIMAMYARAIGIPANHIFTETKAEHSTENIYYGYFKALKYNFKTVALATDPFQSKQLERFTRLRVSPDVAIIPMVYDTLRLAMMNSVDPDIDIKKAYVENFIPLTQRQSAWQRLRGTRGLKIDKSAYK